MNGLFNPPHPGETLREDILPALGLTVTQAASQLGVTRTTLSRVINGRAGISPQSFGTPTKLMPLRTLTPLIVSGRALGHPQSSYVSDHFCRLSSR